MFDVAQESNYSTSEKIKSSRQKKSSRSEVIIMKVSTTKNNCKNIDDWKVFIEECATWLDLNLRKLAFWLRKEDSFFVRSNVKLFLGKFFDKTVKWLRFYLQYSIQNIT